MTKAEVKSMMDDADFNGDGKLDYEEVWRKLFFSIITAYFGLFWL